MSLTIAGRLFTGPFEFAKTVVRPNHVPCVFAIVSKEGEPWDPRFRLLAAGETGEAGTDFASHPGRAQWERAGSEVSIYLHAVSRDADPNGRERQRLATHITQEYAAPHDLLGKP